MNPTIPITIISFIILVILLSSLFKIISSLRRTGTSSKSPEYNALGYTMFRALAKLAIVYSVSKENYQNSLELSRYGEFHRKIIICDNFKVGFYGMPTE